MIKSKIFVAGAFVFVLVIGTTVFASGSNPGSEADPLTTKSYVDSQLNSKVDNLQSQLNKANATITDLQKKITLLEGKVSEPGQKPTTPAPEPSYKNGTVTATSLNVRTGPSTGNPKAGTLKLNAVVSILSTKKVSGATWYEIKAGNLKGWAHGSYIKVK